MQRYEYRVIPAPRKGEKAKGLKTTEARFAHALTQAMNDMAREGWDYLRTDTLPVEERVGLTGRTTTFQHMLVFRKTLHRADTPADAEIASDPLDAAARRAALIARPDFGASAPRLSASADEGQAPPVGPARTEAPDPAAAKSQAAE